MSYHDLPGLGISRASRIVILVVIVLLFVLAPFAFLISRCALTGDCL